jgi:hypothetical protein
MASLSIDILFDAAVRIMIHENSVSVTFTPDSVSIKFPTTRRLAEFLEVPHYYILPYFAMMEQEELLREQRGLASLQPPKEAGKCWFSYRNITVSNLKQ